ncbi:MAG TPA: hypothetical protein VMZ90_03880 [Vicinamibacterales bacterium]|nr:hypothetical protein [Vicinamibacterales bacterium]
MTLLKHIGFSVSFGVLLTASVVASAQKKEGVFDVAAEPIVKGLPYSGEGSTTVKLNMFDGTKAERTVTAKLFRDSSGRTRREQAVAGLEALEPNTDFRAVVHIVDPVAGVFYTLNPAERTALRLPLSLLKGDVKPLRAPFEYARAGVDLGGKDIDGLSAHGHRTITTVPTDQVGNSTPIEIIDERWESTELKVLLRSLHRDPRSGDIEYALTKISRAEPPASMFTVPSGYTIRDAPNERLRELR